MLMNLTSLGSELRMNYTDDEIALLEQARQIEEAMPDVADLMQRTRAGAVSPDEFLKELMGIAIGNPHKVATLMMEPGVPATPGAPSIPRLNPMYEALITETASLDGDVPQLRTMPLPAGAVPAVPVQYEGRSAVVLGRMLQVASDEVRKEADAIEAGAEALQVSNGTGLVARENLPDPAGYERGRLPALRSVQEPSVAQVGSLTRTEEQDAAWRAVSTSQGRRSAVNTITAGVSVRLNELGHKINASPGPVADCDVSVFYRIGVEGPRSMSANFAIIENAVAVLASKLHAAAHESQLEGTLHVEVVNNVPQRIFGWRAGIKRNLSGT
jgi:hypothetical protein